VTELEWVSGKLPTGYHWNLQLIKKSTIHTAVEVAEMLPIASRVLAGFTMHRPGVTAAGGERAGWSETGLTKRPRSATRSMRGDGYAQDGGH
jgi:hypothetical protein